MFKVKTMRKSFYALLAGLLSVASPALARDTPAEAANKKLVLDFYQALNAADAAGTTKTRIQGIAEKYLSPEYQQHAAPFVDLPGPGSARDKLIRLFQTMPPMTAMPAPTTVAIMAEGDRVMMLTARDLPDPATGRPNTAYIFNMFRVRNNRLIEHWDVGTPGMPSPGAGAPPVGMPPPPSTMPPSSSAAAPQDR